jgi:hypothetical protein
MNPLSVRLADNKKKEAQMEPILDCIGRVACVGDPVTGIIEIKYKNFKTRAKIPLGENYTIEREGIITVITRYSPTAFKVESHIN